ncbi:MAG: phosphoribosylamine--glycine ligase N-terminal domain-containing protein [Alphaproteobacteria bacterium]
MRISGRGRREHALALKIAASPLCEALICAPGNPGMALGALRPGRCDGQRCRGGSSRQAERIDFVVVGPTTRWRTASSSAGGGGHRRWAEQGGGTAGGQQGLCSATSAPNSAFRPDRRFTDAAAKAYSCHPSGAGGDQGRRPRARQGRFVAPTGTRSPRST